MITYEIPIHIKFTQASKYRKGDKIFMSTIDFISLLHRKPPHIEYAIVDT
jgi:hypothetical protein